MILKRWAGEDNWQPKDALGAFRKSLVKNAREAQEAHLKAAGASEPPVSSHHLSFTHDDSPSQTANLYSGVFPCHTPSVMLSIYT
jgi:hypothetical protein